jgi:RNA polymerase sigma-70 factor, ECF subfamily
MHGEKPDEPKPLDVAEVFRSEVPYVARALRYFGVPDKDLADVCQEVFIVVHRKLSEFEQRSSLRTWLFRICQRAASDYRKKAYVRLETGVETTPESSAPVDSFTEPLETRRLLLRALEQLDDDKRAVFVLFEIEGLDMKEVAQVMDCPLQTAYSRLHAARRTLAAALREQTRGVA